MGAVQGDARALGAEVHVGAYVPRHLKVAVETSAKAGKLRERGIKTVGSAIERGLVLVLREAGEAS